MDGCTDVWIDRWTNKFMKKKLRQVKEGSLISTQTTNNYRVRVQGHIILVTVKIYWAFTKCQALC